MPVFGGDKVRAVGILKYLSKKNKIDLVCLSNKKINKIQKIKLCHNVRIFKINLAERIFQTLLSLLKGEPLQLGFYYSKRMKDYILKNQSDYNTIIFHTLRASQYISNKFKGKKILEMTDLLSLNYEQTIKKLSIFNLLKYVYFLEYILIKRYENKISKIFDSFIFVSKKDLIKSKSIFSKKNTFIIKNGCRINKKLFKFSKKNHKILFIGNIKYLPNKKACYEFAKKILPKINNYFPDVEFHVVGEINFYDRYILKKYKNIVIHGPVKNINNVAKNCICAVSNVKIATGFQNKIANYISFGIPTIASIDSFKGLNLKRNKELEVYKNNEDLVKKIIKIKKNKIKAVSLSNYGYKAIRNRFDWNKTLFKYGQIV